MANGHGGPRTPRKPAPVSGPGAMSRRTDGGPAKPAYVAGLPYGEGQEFMAQQQAAPMGAQPPRLPVGGPGPAPAPAAPPTPFDAPTEYPDEPMSAGAAYGPGPGPEALAGSARPADVEIIRKYLPALQQAASWQGAPDTFKGFVRWLQGQK